MGIESKESGDYWLWIGLHRDKSDQEDKFIWGSGQTLSDDMGNRTTGHWIPGEPNNYQNTNEDCVNVKWSGSSWGMNDAECSKSFRFICQKRPGPGKIPFDIPSRKACIFCFDYLY